MRDCHGDILEEYSGKLTLRSATFSVDKLFIHSRIVLEHNLCCLVAKLHRVVVGLYLTHLTLSLGHSYQGYAILETENLKTTRTVFPVLTSSQSALPPAWRSTYAYSR